MMRKRPSWAHYRFRERLKARAKRWPGKYVLESSEDGTSKTCGRCGHWHADSKSGVERVYRCAVHACGYTAEHDAHGARNNLLCAYTKIVSGQPLIRNRG